MTSTFPHGIEVDDKYLRADGVEVDAFFITTGIREARLIAVEVLAGRNRSLRVKLID